MRVLLTGLAIVCTAGCVSVNRNEALELAKSGQSVTTVGSAALNNLQVGFEQFDEIQLVNAVLMNRPMPLAAAREEVQKLAVRVRARANLVRALADLYGSLHELAAFDARAEVRSVATDLSDSAFALAGALETSKGELDVESISKAIGEITGEIADLIQRGQLTEANQRFADLLPKVRQLVEQDRATLNVAHELIRELQLTNVDGFLNSGVATYDDVLIDVVSRAGLTYDPAYLALLRRLSVPYMEAGAIERARHSLELELKQARADRVALSAPRHGITGDDSESVDQQLDTLSQQIDKLTKEGEEAATRIEEDLKTKTAISFTTAQAADRVLQNFDLIGRTILRSRLMRQYELQNDILTEFVKGLEELEQGHSDAATFSATDLQLVLANLHQLAQSSKAISDSISASRDAARQARAERDEARAAAFYEAIQPLLSALAASAGIQLPPAP